MDFSNIDHYVADELKRLGIPGMALGIVQGQETVHLQGFGRADTTGRAVMPQTPFYIGSLSKSFTALAIIQLAEAGKLSLDDPVTKYLPWFKLADSTAAPKITLRHVLTQTTGITEKDGNNSWCSTASVEHEVRALSKVSLRYPVGEKFQYSNINYSIAGLVIEVVSGQSYADYISLHIFVPLHMKHSHISRDHALADGLAQGHYYRFGHARAGIGPLPPALLPGGFIISSAEDMTHYLIAHLNGGKFLQNTILSASGIATLHAPAAAMKDPRLHYAMGWRTGPIEQDSVLAHNGDTSHFHASMILVPDKAWGIILLANASGFEQISQVDVICQNVLRLLNHDAKPDPVRLPSRMRVLYWGILLTPLLLLLGVGVGAWQIYFNGLHHPILWSLTALIYLGIAGLSLLCLPGLIPLSLPAMRAFYPELAAGIFMSGMIGICGSALSLLMLFM